MAYIGILIADCVGKGAHDNKIYERAEGLGLVPSYIGHQRVSTNISETQDIVHLLNGLDFNTVEIKLFR